MALRNILTDTDETLRKRSREVVRFDRRLHMLLDDMRETLREEKGAGLAAVQVGVLRRVCIVEVEEGDLVELINPEIVRSEGEQTDAEGCLSIPGRVGIVTRPMKVLVRAQDRDGKTFEVEGEGMKARALCHEVDHLDGKLYSDIALKMASDIDELFDGEMDEE